MALIFIPLIPILLLFVIPIIFDLSYNLNNYFFRIAVALLTLYSIAVIIFGSLN